MSWKGFQKAVVRLPHIVKRKTGNVNETNDAEYENCESQFAVIEECCKRLCQEGKAFKESIKMMLEGHEELMEAFRKILFSSCSSQGDAGAIEASTLANYIDQLGICKLDVLNTLSSCLERQLLKPASILAGHCKCIRAKCTKRAHKLIDYDRHRLELEKLRRKSRERDFSLNDEKKLLKREKEFEQANAEYQAINTLLKGELPQFCALVKKIMLPIASSVIFFQKALVEGNLELCKMFTCTGAAGSRNYTTPSKTSILRDFEKKRAVYSEIMQQCELFSKGEIHSRMNSCTFQEQQEEKEQKFAPALAHALLSSKTLQSVGKGEEFVVALYDYDAQGENGDLSFLVDDRIRVLEKNEDGWWKGSLKGNVGMFPSNYVKKVQI